MRALAGWENFYVVVGSAAGALIGLEFVVVTLIVDCPTLRVAEGVAAFATPTIVHFGAVLLLSAVVSVPWHKIGTVSVVWFSRSQWDSKMTSRSSFSGVFTLGVMGQAFIWVCRKGDQNFFPRDSSSCLMSYLSSARTGRARSAVRNFLGSIQSFEAVA